MKCLKCNSKDLHESGVSQLIEGTYLLCRNCSNVMINKDNKVIATPEDAGETTNLLVADAKKHLFPGTPGGYIAPVISEEDANKIRISNYLASQNTVSYEEDEEDEDDYEPIEEIEEAIQEYDDEDIDCDYIDINPVIKSYLIVTDDNSHIHCYNATKDDVCQALKKCGNGCRLFEITEIELQKEVTYTF